METAKPEGLIEEPDPQSQVQSRILPVGPSMGARRLVRR